MDNPYILREFNYQNAKALQALITAMGMFAGILKDPGKYSREDFEKLIEEFGIHHNAIISAWNDAIN